MLQHTLYFKHRLRENSNRGEIVFCYEFMPTKAKKFLLNETKNEKERREDLVGIFLKMANQVVSCLQN